MEGLTTLGENVFYGIFLPENMTFLIYDACVIQSEAITQNGLEKRRSRTSQFLRTYTENRAKKNLTCPLQLELKEPVCNLNEINKIESCWKLNGGFTSFLWQNSAYISEGVVFFPKDDAFFMKDDPLLYKWKFPYLLTVNFHVSCKLPIQKKPYFKVYDPRKRDHVIIQEKEIPPAYEKKLRALAQEQLACRSDMSAMIISARYNPSLKIWEPMKLMKTQQSTRPYFDKIYRASIDMLHWKEISQPLLKRGCHSCNPGKNVRHLYLPSNQECYQKLLKYANINKDKGLKPELIATPKQHVKEFWNLSKKQDGYQFWWAMMKFFADHLFAGITPNKLGTPGGLVKKVNLEISYGKWIKHEHAHVHILFHNFQKTCAELGFPATDIKQESYPGSDVTMEIKQFSKIGFDSWCWKPDVHNSLPLCLWVYEWFGQIPGFTFRIELRNEGKEKPQYKTKYSIRVSKAHEFKLQELIQFPPSEIEKVLQLKKS